jgi:hypothetical protein
MRSLKRQALSILDRELGPTTTDAGGADALPGSGGLDARTLSEVRHLLGELAGAGASDELVALGRELAGHAGEMRQATLVWIDVIETLVQDAEGRHGARGRGAVKRREITWVVEYLLRTERLRIPDVPAALQPVAIDLCAEVSIRALVTVLDDHALLMGRPAARSARVAATLRWSWHQFWRPLELVSGPIARWLSRPYSAVRYHRALSPTLQSALAALEETNAASSGRGTFDALESLFRWLAEHPEVVGALSRLVSIAVTEAERWSALDGPSKKRLAEDIILGVLRDLGLGQGLLGSTIAQVSVDVAVDAIVGVFNKRHFFLHANRVS